MGTAGTSPVPAATEPGSEEMVGAVDTESGQTLQGSFSAASKPHFASKYAFESSRRDLHKLQIVRRSSPRYPLLIPWKEPMITAAAAAKSVTERGMA